MTNWGVNSHQDQKVTKFCKQVISQCNNHHLAEHLMHLQTLQMLGPADINELECIDEQITTILLCADRHCQPMNPNPWSPELNQAYLRHWLWMIALSTHKNDCNMSDIINSIKTKLWPSLDDDDEHLQSISANLWWAQKNLRKVKSEADHLCHQHLENLLNEAKAANCCKKTSALTYLIRAEQNQRCYFAFWQHTKPKSAGGLAYLLDTNAITNKTTMILDCEEMEHTLLDYRRTHFATA